MAEDRIGYLERLIAGLEQAVENTRGEIPYYKPDDIQLRYAKKFLAAVEENLAKSQKELAELRNTLDIAKNPPRG